MPNDRPALPGRPPHDISAPSVRARLNAIAHELNNLLTIINGYSELLLKQLDNGDVRGQVLEIRQAGTRVSELNEELLSIVRTPVAEADAPVRACPCPGPSAGSRPSAEWTSGQRGGPLPSLGKG